MPKCTKHQKTDADSYCEYCGKPFCANCLFVINDVPICRKCATQNSKHKDRILLFDALTTATTVVSVVLFVASFSFGEKIQPIFFFSSLFFLLLTVVFRLLSDRCLAKTYTSYQTWKLKREMAFELSGVSEDSRPVVHKITFDDYVFPEKDSFGNPLLDEQDIRLSGYSQTKFGTYAQDGISNTEMDEQVFLKHDASNAYDEHAIYAVNKYDEFLGWIPNTSRYKKYKAELLPLLSNTNGSYLATFENLDCEFHKNKNSDFEESFIICILHVARYSSNVPETTDNVKKYSVKDPAAEIAKYKALLDSGAITLEEYNAKKKQLLDL